MNFLAPLQPFGRLSRLPYAAIVLACLALGWLGLNVTRFGGEDWMFGPIIFWPALYLLFCAMVNRIRDARASAGWFLFPVFVTVFAIVTAIYSGPTDIAGHIFGGTALEKHVVTAPFRALLALPAIILPFLLALAVSLFVWAFSFLMLAFLPTRASQG
ncbi:MAG: hypothetical protein ACK4MV_20925 [Beijerinckiaceae bacterium]